MDRLAAIEAILERSALEAERREAAAERRNVEFDMLLKQSKEEADKRAAEADKRAAEADKRAAEADKRAAERAAEAERRNAEYAMLLKQSKEEADKRAEEADKRTAEFDKKMAELRKSMNNMANSISQTEKMMGGMANSNGEVAHEYFFNALSERKTLFGQEFDEVVSDRKKKIKKIGVAVQYDIVLINGKSFCIVEVKWKANTDDVIKMSSSMVKKFRETHPEHNDKNLYIALASMSFNAYVEEACKKHGIAMIKPLGDTIEIFDEHLKAY